MMEKLFITVCDVIIFVVIVTSGWAIMECNEYNLAGVLTGLFFIVFPLLFWFGFRSKE